MKIITLLILLIFSVVSYANDINFLKLLKRNVVYDEEVFINSLSKECKNEYKNSEYNVCMPEINLSNYKNACSDINTEKCQSFYKDPLKYYPICKDIPEFNELYQQNIMITLKQSLDVACQTDENDDICPFSLYLVLKTSNDNSVDDDTNNIDVLLDQCGSKKCTESLIKVYKDLKIDQYTALENSSYTTGSYTYQEINTKNDIISILESEECQSLHDTGDDTNNDTADNTNDDKSGSTTIKINYLLIILFSLLLINK